MISVIIPMFNAENSIKNALDSVKNQSFPTEMFEIIVVNDGSTDKSLEIVENYILDHPELKISLISQPNNGVSNARNTGLKLAAGEYIALLDADDEWYPQKTKRQIPILETGHLEVDFLACRRKNHEILFPYTVGPDNLAAISFRKLMIRNETQPSTVIFKRKVLANAGYFDDNQRYAEDLNYWLKVSEHHKMFILNEELVLTGGGKRTFGVSGLSANLEEMEKGFQKNLKEVFQFRRIGILRYIGYFIFYKLKYILRISRNKILNWQGKY
ncbi:glycosyltransferase family 2 protein [Kaistella yonginensis]|uniref:glycosyltransferase family 2 protein n=1 Tax=Kaistella yonginensis TaxID=658267 RepID=UPI0025B3C6F3|nr:glycosyltransferase [Kaistella yonginensis]MDN3605810.1 glycosyltransferase [Kaistella yonginensis]